MVASGAILAMMHLVNGMAVRRDHAHTRSLSLAVCRLTIYSLFERVRRKNEKGGFKRNTM
jgi:hypothetical protein